jgi:hypothetical protein
MEAEEREMERAMSAFEEDARPSDTSRLSGAGSIRDTTPSAPQHGKPSETVRAPAPSGHGRHTRCGPCVDIRGLPGG